MRRFAMAVLAAAAFAAAPPDGVVHWPASALKGYAGKLRSKMNELKVATEQLGDFGRHSVMVAYREATGEAEIHENMTDIFVVQSGEATLVTGGKVVAAKSTGPGEIRGRSIEGGASRKIGPGDVVNIPANLPHQVVLAPGAGPFTYMIVKVQR